MSEEGVPFIAVGNGELTDPLIGDTIECPHCGEKHNIEYGTSRTRLPDGTMSEPVVSRALSFYSCKDKTYLAGIDGKRL